MFDKVDGGKKSFANESIVQSFGKTTQYTMHYIITTQLNYTTVMRIIQTYKSNNTSDLLFDGYFFLGLYGCGKNGRCHTSRPRAAWRTDSGSWL